MATPFSSGQHNRGPLCIIRKYTPSDASPHRRGKALTQTAAPRRHEAKRGKRTLLYGSPSSLAAERETSAAAPI